MRNYSPAPNAPDAMNGCVGRYIHILSCRDYWEAPNTPYGINLLLTTMTDGIYILGNDVVFDHLIALLNSLEVNAAPNIPVCIIPYNDNLQKVRLEIASRSNVTLFENTDSIQYWEDFATKAWTSHEKAQKTWQAKGWAPVHCLGMHRKFCCFDGDFDKFVYFDADTLSMGSLDYIYQKLDEFDWVANDFQYKSDLNYVFDLSSEKLAEIFPIDKLESQIFCAGWFASKKGILNRYNSAELLNKLMSGEAEVLSLRGTDQPLFNYLVARSSISFYNFAYHQREQVTGNHWSSQFEVIDCILYDRGRRLTYLHYMSISAAKFTQLCAGEDVEIPYRDVFLHYRYLHSPQTQPQLAPPSLWVSLQRNFKSWGIQRVNNVLFKLRILINKN
ncbi:Npun_R2821/Npun_R2822 family protein [Microcoleus sp. bin38.metabat.b11b12b14.051]|uniref:Npun_R2821/Npun_R2822 family protein n=1 Tax=Microcoleus sp. bin38.metabat.b11b12b14.051 TaxID=2742709 RepID=UPI0025D8FA6C|nr:Npun_R2821/Npun_R2822 family protein [Microcoleus sp. bin38.metabat.b11b12b14.051]